MDSNIVIEANLFIIRFLKHHTNKSVQQIIDHLQEENSRLFSQQEEQPVMQAGEPVQISRVPEANQPYIPEAPTVPPAIEIVEGGAGEIGDMFERQKR